MIITFNQKELSQAVLALAEKYNLPLEGKQTKITFSKDTASIEIVDEEITEPTVNVEEEKLQEDNINAYEEDTSTEDTNLFEGNIFK